MNDYIEKVQREIDRIENSGGSYWYDFGLNREKMLALETYFSDKYSIEVTECKSCSGDSKKYDVTITL